MLSVPVLLFSLCIQFPCPVQGVHVLHIQGALHQQLYRNPRVPHSAGDRPRATDGCQLPRLLDHHMTRSHVILVCIGCHVVIS